MRKCLLTCLILLLAAAAMAQQKTTIHLVKSDHGVGQKINGVNVGKVYKGIFKQQYSILESDSAYVYWDQNRFDAFGHVVITQGDTLHIYADTLHYDDNTKIAILTNHVKMVDKDATLTTNNFNYNTATRYGTYVNGGKLVNKDNVLTSINGYYFAQSRDAYFRYNVVLTTPDALIKTDTLRYNSGSRIAYFYGPTNIYGKKDKDTLYTENGTYNTKTEQAFFGKKNLYKQGTKSLKGDSLFYDRLKGYGKAIKNITFMDTEQKIILKGNLGEYFKQDDKAVVTLNPYVIFVTEEKDTTAKAADTTGTVAAQPAKPDTLQQAVNDLMPLVPVDQKALAALIPKNASKATADSITKAFTALAAAKIRDSIDMASMQKQITKSRIDSLTAALGSGKLKDSLKTREMIKALTKATADSIVKANTPLARMLATNATKNIIPDTARRIKPVIAKSKPKPGAKTARTPAKNTQPVLKPFAAAKNDTTRAAKNDSAQAVAKPAIPIKDTVAKNRPDTMYIGADTLETQIVTYKELKNIQEQRRLAGIRDTSAKLRKPFEPYTSIPKELFLNAPTFIGDSLTFVDRPLFAPVKPLPADTTQKLAETDSTNNNKKAPGKKTDAVKKPKTSSTLSLLVDEPRTEPADTARVRILSAHHNVKIFKSDLQGKADSLFYSSADSVIRSFIKPIYWVKGSQLTGDTVFMQLKNKKLDRMDVFNNAFVVNLEKGDSTHFNQMAGKHLRAFFKASKIDRVIDYGNAEAIYWKRDSGKISGMSHSLSSAIDARFKNGDIAKTLFLTKHDGNYFPLKMVKDDDKILKGFIWKPSERPASKEAVIHPVKPAPAVDTVKKRPATKPSAKGKTTTNTGKTPATRNAPKIVPKAGAVKPAGNDNTTRPDSLSAGKPVDAGKDTTTAPAVKAPVQPRRDTSTKKTDTLKKPTSATRDSVVKKP